MMTPKKRFPSFAHTISALGIVLYCVGFVHSTLKRVELEFKKRLYSLENVAKGSDPPSSGPNAKVIKNSRCMYFSLYVFLALSFVCVCVFFFCCCCLCSLKGQSSNSSPEAVERIVKCSPKAKNTSTGSRP